jgi:hypothetical protein
MPLHSFSTSGPVRAMGHTEWQPEARDLQVSLALVNPTSDTVRVSFGPCSFDLRAYRSPTRRDAPVWQWPSPRMCKDMGIEFRLPPGRSHTIDVRQLLHQKGPGRLPEGPLYFGIVVREPFQERLHMIPAGGLNAP